MTWKSSRRWWRLACDHDEARGGEDAGRGVGPLEASSLACLACLVPFPGRGEVDRDEAGVARLLRVPVVEVGDRNLEDDLGGGLREDLVEVARGDGRDGLEVAQEVDGQTQSSLKRAIHSRRRQTRSLRQYSMKPYLKLLRPDGQTYPPPCTRYRSQHPRYGG